MTHLSFLLNSKTVLYTPSPIHRWLIDSSKCNFTTLVYKYNICRYKQKVAQTIQTDMLFVHFIAPFTADGRPDISSSYFTYNTQSKSLLIQHKCSIELLCKYSITKYTAFLLVLIHNDNYSVS